MKARSSGAGRGCEARQYSDQMQCARCGLAYDVNDPEPPDCLTREQASKLKGQRALARILADLTPPSYAIDPKVN